MPCEESWIYCYDLETKRQSPRGSMLALPDPRWPNRANPPTNFWWSLFWQHWHDLHVLDFYWTESQQGILCWGFKGVQKEIPREEASTHPWKRHNSKKTPPAKFTLFIELSSCDQYWTGPGGNTQQSSSFKATYHPSRKLSKLNEPDMQDTGGEVDTSSLIIYSYGPLHMAEQKQDDQLEPTYSSSVRIRGVPHRTCRKRWTIGRGVERGSGISVLMARQDDECSTRNNILVYLVWKTFFLNCYQCTYVWEIL